LTSVADVERALHRLFIVEPRATLRREDVKKAREVAALLGELERVRRGVVVDAAGGHAYVGLLAAELLGAERVIVIERDHARAARCRDAATRLARATALDVREGDVHDAALWPDAPDAVVGLHACGAASDGILDRAIAVRARFVLLVPCCYADRDAHAADSPRARADAVTRHAPLRRKLVEAFTDAARAARLEAAGYDVTLVPFVPPTVTPHNLLFRARRVSGRDHRQDAKDAKIAKGPGGNPTGATTARRPDDPPRPR
jgi:precorrin-6B methylase 2